MTFFYPGDVLLHSRIKWMGGRSLKQKKSRLLFMAPALLIYCFVCGMLRLFDAVLVAAAIAAGYITAAQLLGGGL